ncbi:MAG: multiubiquitin domain-containing protein [Candidatus Thiodiazotropha sp. (ex Epidulcina cf. delphinae)]|nr:multiubiquitin domain-containing protein [Candidatus Thiodiazotropha sp. (ex Epidulcina cf. delphinae)]
MKHEHEKKHDDHEKRPETYHILVDHRPHDWPKPEITGVEIKQLAGVDNQTFDAWQDVPGPEDKLIADTDTVDLTCKGTEKFFTIKKTTTEG